MFNVKKKCAKIGKIRLMCQYDTIKMYYISTNIEKTTNLAKIELWHYNCFK